MSANRTRLGCAVTPRVPEKVRYGPPPPGRANRAPFGPGRLAGRLELRFDAEPEVRSAFLGLGSAILTRRRSGRTSTRPSSRGRRTVVCSLGRESPVAYSMKTGSTNGPPFLGRPERIREPSSRASRPRWPARSVPTIVDTVALALEVHLEQADLFRTWEVASLAEGPWPLRLDSARTPSSRPATLAGVRSAELRRRS